MMAAVEEGRCLLGPQQSQEAWGNRIPRRAEVKPGTKGSRKFVAAVRGGVGVKDVRNLLDRYRERA